MKILILHHRPLYRLDKSVSGAYLRIQQLQKGLSAYNHEVATLCVLDKSSAECRQHISSWGAHCVIAMHAQLINGLEGLGVPLILDLYAQRLMEALFEEGLISELMVHLSAFRQCTMFLVSNMRQRRSWQGILALLGAHLKPESIIVVPLAATLEPEREEPNTFTLIGGGMCWPWQNPWPAIGRALKHLDLRGTGKVIWVGAKEITLQHPRLQYISWGSYAAYRSYLSNSTAAFDWMVHNVEREFAIAFRHMDYVGCGLPILTGSYSPLKDVGKDFYCASDDIESVLDRCIDQPEWLAQMRRASLVFAQAHSASKSVQELVPMLEKIAPLEWSDSPLLQPIDLWKQLKKVEQSEQKLRVENKHLHEDREKKSHEIAEQNKRIAQQATSIAQLSSTIESVVTYRKEVVQVLGQQIQQHSHAHDSLASENAILRADIEKKSAELAAMDQLVSRLENDVQSLRLQLERKKGFFRKG